MNTTQSNCGKAPLKASAKALAAFNYWPFASFDVEANRAEKQGRDYLHHVIKKGTCLSAVLADAYQSPSTTCSVIARAAFVDELVRLAKSGGAA